MRALRYADLPKCCKKCIYREWDSQDEYSPPFSYCSKNLILPTAKQECRKQKEAP